MPLSTAAPSGRVHSFGGEKSSSLFYLTLTFTPFARMRGKASKPRGAALAITGRATLHPGRIGEPTHFTSFPEDRVTHLGFGDVDKKYL